MPRPSKVTKKNYNNFSQVSRDTGSGNSDEEGQDAGPKPTGKRLCLGKNKGKGKAKATGFHQCCEKVLVCWGPHEEINCVMFVVGNITNHNFA